MWPETWPAAAYIYNRSPREQNGWKTPRETLLKWLRANNKDVADLMDQPDTTNLYTYGCRAYPIRKEVLANKDKAANKTQARTHIGYLVGYGGSNIYRIWVPQNGEILTVRDVEFEEDEMFAPTTEPMREYRLRVYRNDPNKVKPLPDPNPPRDQDTDSEIGSVIVVGDEIDQGGDGIYSGDSADDSDYENEPGDYPTPESMEEQANLDVSSESSPAASPPDPSSEPETSPEPIPSESSSSRAETPSSSSSEPPQRRNRYGRALITPDEAT